MSKDGAREASLAGSLEPGDRLEVLPAGADRFAVATPPGGWPATVGRVEDESGRAVEVGWDAERGVLTLGRPSAAREPLWLEYREGGCFCLVGDAPLSDEESRPFITEQGLQIALDERDAELLAEVGSRPAGLPEFRLAARAARLSAHAGFDRLICLPLVREMEALDYQIRTACTVLQRFRGRAMLCDEVGLGKTIEAGLVFAELATRGLVRSALVLVPPSLIEQWQGEMRRKFGLDLVSHDDPAFRDRGASAWDAHDLVIASIHTAKREPHRSAILARKWDLVIVDEAHHLRNRGTQLWRFASELSKQYILLLTATPVQNNLEELHNLVTLLEPGLLRTARQFSRRFVDRKDKLTPKNLDELHALLSEVMVRNRRSTVGLQFTRRFARTEVLPPRPTEAGLYHEAAAFVREQLSRSGPGGPFSRMALLTLQMALGSSSRAAAGTLATLAESQKAGFDDRAHLRRLAELAQSQTESSKLDRLLELVREFGDKMVVFTQFRATQELLGERLLEAGHDVAVFHGGLSRLAKEEAVRRFQRSARLLLCTEAGSEGRNLQFAHGVCNFDLPWNPMRIEQRIGRLSRIGQTRDVHVFNLVAAGTIEAAVLHLLEAKLNMFELVIGEIDMILGNLEDEREFPDLVADLWAQSSDGDDFRARMEELGNRLLSAKEAYLRQRAHDDRLFGDRFAPTS
jgi:SNF2 family DNA or RNA helicase